MSLLKLVAAIAAFSLSACGGGGKQAVAPQEQKQITVAFMGDSTVAGVQGILNAKTEPFNQLLPEKSYAALIQAQSNGRIKSVNLAVGSGPSNTSHMREIEYPLALAANPDIVVMSTGLNDVVNNYSDSDYIGNYQVILQDLQSRKIKIVLLTPLVGIPYLTYAQDAKVAHFADLMKQLAVQYNATLIDTRALESVVNGVNTSACNAYDLHPCDYQPFANAILPVLLKL